MKKVLLIVLALVLGAGGVIAYRGYEFFKAVVATTVRGSGQITTETRAMGSFTAIRLSGVGTATVERTGTPGLSISGDDNLLPLITSEVKDGTLHLSTKVAPASTQPKWVRVTVGALREIHVAGSASLRADDLVGAVIAVEGSGAGRVRLSGRTEALTVAVSGAGSLDATALNAKRAIVETSGAGSVSVNVSDTLDARASGAGSVRYVGEPKLTSHVSGAGSIRQARQ